MNSNAANGGLVLKSLNKLYVTDIAHYSGTTVIDLETGESGRIDGILWFMNDEYPYIYYSDQQRDHALFRYHVNSQTSEKLLDKPCYGLRVVNDWIYYIHEEDRKLYRCKLNGANDTRLTDEWVISFSISGERIYYATKTGIRVCQMDGLHSQLISDHIALHMVIVQNKLFFLNKNNNHVLTMLDLTTGTASSYSELSAVGLNSDGRYLYCANVLNGKTIYRLDPERGSSIRICGDIADYVHIIEDKIYFWSGTDWHYISLLGGQAVNLSAQTRG